MQTKGDASLDFLFLMQMFFTRMQMLNVHMMQTSHAGVQMESLSMMVSAHIFNCDANVSLQGWRCKNLVVQMPPCRYAMMQMLPWVCNECECSRRYAMDANALMQT